MTIQEMKIDLIKRFEAKKLTAIVNYKKKLGGMVSSAIQQEYDLVVLGKEYKPVKLTKKDKKNLDKGNKILADRLIEMGKDKDDKQASEEDVKGVW